MSRALASRKNAWKKKIIFPLRYYANCVSTTVTVLLLRNVEVSISFIVIWYFVLPASLSCTNLVSLSLHCLMHSLRTIATLCADWSLNNPRPPFRLSIESLSTPAFGWWIPSIVRSFLFFRSIFSVYFLNQLPVRSCKRGLVHLRCWWLWSGSSLTLSWESIGHPTVIFLH